MKHTTMSHQHCKPAAGLESREQILSRIHHYLQTFPEENERVALLLNFVNQYWGEALYNRKNFDGHLTASAFIIDSSATSLLLLRHKFLNRWLQPGGHIDATDASIADAAMRE